MNMFGGGSKTSPEPEGLAGQAGIARKRPEIGSMLVIHQGALGDFILALPTLRALRKAFPEARSVIMGYPRILELVEKRFYADEILSVDQRGMASFFVPDGSLDFALSQVFGTFELVVVFGKDEKSALVRNLKRVCQGQILHINSFPPPAGRIHLTDHLTRQFKGYDLLVEELNPRLYLTEADENWSKNLYRRKGLTVEEKSGVILLHPGSGSRKKVWPIGRFVELVRYLQSHSKSRILIVLGPAEGPEVQKTFEGIEWEMGPVAPILLRGLSLLQLASVMKGCRFFIGNDSGISHMAVALGLPTVAIFGPTDPDVWSPRGEKVAVVHKKISCCPCPQEKFFRCKQLKCLEMTEVEDVLEGIRRLGVTL
jgi:ADP-heptose:LPS heptosyltransferase